MTHDKRVTYSMREIPVARIRVFAAQPRKWFNPEEIRLKAESMRATGQQSPVTVEPVAGDPEHDYELIDGESRLRSARQAGLKTLWAAVRSEPFASVADKHLSSLVANFNRSGHTPMEISDALHLQITEGKRDPAELAQALGKSSYFVDSYLSLQKLHPSVKARLVPAGELPATAGFQLARLPTDKQLEVIKAATDPDGRVTKTRVQIEVDRISVRKTRANSPSKRREKILNSMRAIRLDTEKLQAAAGSHAADVAKLLQGDSIIEEGIATLQYVRSVARLQKRSEDVAVPRMLDTHAMGEEQLAEYLEQWRQYWLRVGVHAERKNNRDPLLIEIAYGRRLIPKRRG